MKAFLMHPGRDLDLAGGLPPAHEELTQDLALATLLEAMAHGDEFVYDVARNVLLRSLTDPGEILYRQEVLRDCLRQPSTVREIYTIAVEAINGERKVFGGFFLSRSPDLILHRSVEVLRLLTGQLRQLRRVADSHAGEFASEGFSGLFAMLTAELDDEYFEIVNDHLRRLKFSDGVLISAGLGAGNHGRDHVLRRPAQARRGLARPMGLLNRSSYTLTVPDRDENGARALAELRGRGINLVANALAQSTDHILSFFTMLRSELAFYIGCLNAHGRLTGKGEPVCFPEPCAPGTPVLTARGLYDVCLALSVPGRVVGNDMDADGKSLVMITGANQGGKSTFLRSVGLSRLMMQCGMFVGAQSLRAAVAQGVFTHYRREEDATMTSGKLDEELARMSEIADHIRPGCLLLCNESFAATNEREGSQIAREVVRAMVDSGVTVFFVTHLFDLADSFHRGASPEWAFLRAQRKADGRRTFRLAQEPPLPTSFGEDIYTAVFGADGGSGGK